ncbi:hypothetical protein [Pseudoalteromonas luteoviolacea]|uniref:Uncharacterized protein n=1 Tax=Pseudoalteromonas luteoviolacea DSM 6061 TaxID=1365250 RepID=A0A166W8N5_9GAMM|nr:hypothetical protein [Pseudoalteromonas luteoviolacea]KZN36220.1 hypothetical protein N475_17645 [Pseudoalteromonas luteoviolacea DSM 6061]KZN51510.1 hypothetical protein N474_24010 [Pseudoalteromonas luteoviolacea CPMOR-2]MBE0386664.1 hypothetical protein [Pseudoalteromonas luteoviolacea DSM 6061]TQF71512.1 hypothetical protein FLM44_10645 [Pseudoalteromonas luteoviolacea]
MNEFLDLVSWVLRALMLIIVVYILHCFKQYRFSLLFGGSDNLKTRADHELHSCFLTALVTTVFFMLFQQLLDYIETLPIERMALRQIYYFIAACASASIIITLTLLHAVRGCTFSPVARYVCYLQFIAMVLKTVQLIIYGYWNITSFRTGYSLSILTITIVQFVLVAKYPFKIFMINKFAKES